MKGSAMCNKKIQRTVFNFDQMLQCDSCSNYFASTFILIGNKPIYLFYLCSQCGLEDWSEEKYFFNNRFSSHLFLINHLSDWIWIWLPIKEPIEKHQEAINCLMEFNQVLGIIFV